MESRKNKKEAYGMTAATDMKLSQGRMRQESRSCGAQREWKAVAHRAQPVCKPLCPPFHGPLGATGGGAYDTSGKDNISQNMAQKRTPLKSFSVKPTNVIGEVGYL